MNGSTPRRDGAAMNQPVDHRASPRRDDAASVAAPRPGAAAHHQERMRVAWADTDASGRIHFTAAFRWAEVAEHALLRRLGLSPPGNADGFPRRHVEATYHKPLRFADEFDLVLAAERVGRTSVTYAWQAIRDGQVCVEGRTVTVHVDGDGIPAPLPRALRELAG
jgi:YbgC/YbaW family acyl-CoA thioester hydrolase